MFGLCVFFQKKAKVLWVDDSWFANLVTYLTFGFGARFGDQNGVQAIHRVGLGLKVKFSWFFNPKGFEDVPEWG